MHNSISISDISLLPSNATLIDKMSNLVSLRYNFLKLNYNLSFTRPYTLKWEMHLY